MSRYAESQKWHKKAQSLIPGGVNSPVRSFKSVGLDPLTIKRAEGAYLYDIDGNRYIDYIGSFGPAILGHSHPAVVEAVTSSLLDGFSYGQTCPKETELAEIIQRNLPSMEQIRFVSSGTEACMSAIRLARGFTGRNKVVKFIGCYHGHADLLLVEAGSGVATLGIPGSLGVPKAATEDTLSIPFNDEKAVRQVFSELGPEIACVILEPIVGNAGFIRPQPGFLAALSEITKEHGALLIFDEVMTGFRVGLSGAQGLYGIKPDLTTLAKVIGGGLPIGAFGGRKDVMACLAPLGGVYQAGTLSGNPVAMTAGIATLTELERSGLSTLIARTKTLAEGLKEEARYRGIPLVTDFEGGMFGMNFRAEPVTNYDDAKNSHHEAFNRFFKGMMDLGILLAPSSYEASFISLAHTEKDIHDTLAAARKVFKQLS